MGSTDRDLIRTPPPKHDPTRSGQGKSRGGDRQGPRSRLHKPSPAPRHGNLANAVARPRSLRPAFEPSSSCPQNLEEQKLLATGVYGPPTWSAFAETYDESTGSHAAGGGAPWARKVNCGPTKRGSKKRAFEHGEQRDEKLPEGGKTDRSGSLLPTARLPGMVRPRPGRGEQPSLKRRPGERLQPGATSLAKAGTSASRRSGNDRQSRAIGDRTRPLCGRARETQDRGGNHRRG